MWKVKGYIAVCWLGMNGSEKVEETNKLRLEGKVGCGGLWF